MRLNYLKTSRPALFLECKQNGTLARHLQSIEDEAAEMLIHLEDKYIEKNPLPKGDDFMPLFNNRELESLQAENDKLKDNITTLEIHLSAKDKAIAEMRREIDTLETQVEEYRSAIEEYKTIAANSVPFHEIEKIKQNYYNEIVRLKSDISRLQTRPLNERGAGRKRKATPEQVEQILSLSANGYSQCGIAKILTEQSGSKWNRSTVRNTSRKSYG